MYVVYCQNKPKSEFIVAEYDTYFEVSDILTDISGVKLFNGIEVMLAGVFDIELRKDKHKWKCSDADAVCLPGNPAGHQVQVDHQRLPHQTHPENHQIPAAAEGTTHTVSPDEL